MNDLTTDLPQLRNVIVHYRTLENRIIITMDLLTPPAFAFIMFMDILRATTYLTNLKRTQKDKVRFCVRDFH